MTPLPHWLLFLIGALATWRMAMLLTKDSGPMKVFQKLRSYLKREARHNAALRKTDIAEGIQCLRCSSLWCASLVASYGWYHDSITGWWLMAGDTFLLGMSLSAAAIVIHRAFQVKP